LRGSRFVWTAVVGICVVVYMIQLHQFLAKWQTIPSLDDAYVFCRYADHLLSGWGLAWNPGGPQTFGCTSLLYTFWIAALRFLTDLPCWKVLSLGSWIPALAAVFVTGFACMRVASLPALRHPAVGIGFVCLCTCLQQAFFFHAKSGMDTTTAILANALLVLVVVDPQLVQSNWRVVLAGFAAYLTFLARPDNLLYATLFPGILLFAAARGGSRRRRLAVLFVVVFGALLLVDGVVKTVVFGNPLPLPYYAKAGSFYEGYIGNLLWNPIRYARFFVINQMLPVLIMILAVSRRSWRLVVAVMIPCVLTFGYYGTVTQIMGFKARFYYPAMPFLIVAAYHALDTRVALFREGRLRFCFRRLAVRLVMLGACAVLTLPLAGKGAEWYEERCRRLFYTNILRSDLYEPAQTAPRLGWSPSMNAVGRMVLYCPAQVVWAMSEHGIISASAPNVTIIDLAGLHDRNTLSGKSTIDHMFERKPDVIWFPHSDYTGMVNAIQTHVLFAEEYDYWPGAFDYGLAVRRDTPYKSEIGRALRETWRMYYRIECPPPSIRIR